MRISPDGKEISVTPADLMLGSLTLRIDKHLPLKVTTFKEGGSLVIKIMED